MNSQELLNLQEAYLDVYLLDEANRGDEHVTASMYMSKEPYTTSAKKYRRQGRDFEGVLHPDDWDTEGEPVRQQQHIERRGVKTRGSGVRETVDIYDIILSHLLDEGYADTQEQAEAIMVNMSEDWRESIMEMPYQIYGPDPTRSSDSPSIPLGKPYISRKEAKKRADEWDQAIGGYRHSVHKTPD